MILQTCTLHFSCQPKIQLNFLSAAIFTLKGESLTKIIIRLNQLKRSKELPFSFPQKAKQTYMPVHKFFYSSHMLEANAPFKHAIWPDLLLLALKK